MKRRETKINLFSKNKYNSFNIQLKKSAVPEYIWYISLIIIAITLVVGIVNITKKSNKNIEPPSNLNVQFDVTIDPNNVVRIKILDFIGSFDLEKDAPNLYLCCGGSCKNMMELFLADKPEDLFVRKVSGAVGLKAYDGLLLGDNNYLFYNVTKYCSKLKEKISTIKLNAAGLSASLDVKNLRGFYINDTRLFSQSRSYGLVVTDNAVTNILFNKTYDIYGDSNNAALLRDKIFEYNNTDNWIFILTYDEPRNNRLTNNLPAAIKSIGGSYQIFESSNFKFRSAYILIGKPELGENRGLEFYIGNVDSDPNAWISVTLIKGKDGDFLALCNISAGENYLFSQAGKLTELGLAKLYYPRQCFEKGAIWQLYYGNPDEGGVMLAQDKVDRKWEMS
jgi:hypothetical protein